MEYTAQEKGYIPVKEVNLGNKANAFAKEVTSHSY
jgi:hypothetical protein